MSELTLKTETVDGVAVFIPAGRIDSQTSKTFEEAVLAAIAAGSTRMVFDFADLAYISSAGLRVVLLAGKRVRTAGGKLVLANLQPAIREVFEISGFLNLFTVTDDRAAAVAATA
ncbi:STAS domain-containing protein [Acuticoccus sp. MNP-M23]|uniref:STAS domain-containing protein n=1 Tax=Acuticoccus sp. MNP-M23 TaxID=3072793 RepID=UPI0028162E72|nr:STAS domain-containing protein [Acuticoccus sp. MNP-M23]WMS42980.1 STAS domain-containing protein [Acuticoccus sp. MNP-M23]